MQASFRRICPSCFDTDGMLAKLVFLGVALFSLHLARLYDRNLKSCPGWTSPMGLSVPSPLLIIYQR
jgi:hypothetical protein